MSSKDPIRYSPLTFGDFPKTSEMFGEVCMALGNLGVVGAVVSALDSGSSAVFLGKTLDSHSASLHSGVQMSTWKLNAWGSPAME